MPSTRLYSSLITAALAVAPSVAFAATAQPRSQREAAPTGPIDRDAIAALDRMGAFLRAQKSFVVHTTAETDYVMPSGQKIRLSEYGELKAQRPDHLRVSIVSDRKERQMYYDGATFTIFAPRVGYYASVPAPPTIVQLVDALQDRYDLEVPMVDLFRWGTASSDVGEITSAVYVGPAKVDGVDTDQYAFRQPGLDWQIWIERGERALPRRLILTTTDDPTRPERAVALTWDLGVSIPCSTFTFVPPRDAKKIALGHARPSQP